MKGAWLEDLTWVEAGERLAAGAPVVVPVGARANVFSRPLEYVGDPQAGANYSATGVRGDPTLATVEQGVAILDAMVDDLVKGLCALDEHMP